MNSLIRKSFSSYKRFLKTLLIRGFTFASDSDIYESERKDAEKRKAEEEKANNNNLNKTPNSSNENDALKEEAIRSPGQVALRNFLRNPLGVFGLVLFIALILVVFVGSAILPFNQYYSQGNLTNVAPGGAYMNFPNEMESEGTKKISIGNTFAIGLTNEGNIHVWGSDNEDKILTIPKKAKEALKNQKVIDVAAGDRHIIFATEDNQIYGWGNNSFDQTKMPPMSESQIKEEGIKKTWSRCSIFSNSNK